MDRNSLANKIVMLRKKKGMTQQELADKLMVAPKTVSKWENGLLLPDITMISKLANTLGVDSSYLVDLCKEKTNAKDKQKLEGNSLLNLILKSLALAMGVAVFVLSITGNIQVIDGISMISISIICIAFFLFLN